MQQMIARTRHQPVTESLGGWRLVRTVAESRWFTVYLAAPASCDPDWPPDYIVKCVRMSAARDNRPRQLLSREKQVGSEVSHPNLATILDADLDHDPPFVVQPFYEGTTVRELLGSASLGISRALWIARQVAQGISALHQAGWLHGDIKPENVIVSPSGHATLIDLGFAGRLIPAGRRIDVSLQTTLAYAAPEFFQPHSEVSSSSDVYSLGVMLYELLVGRHPFDTSDAHQLACQHLHAEVPDARRFNPLVPADVSRLVTQMLSKTASARPTTRELVPALVSYEIACFSLR